MFCPKCSEPKKSEETQFCTSCGLDLSGLDEFVKTDGSRTNNASFEKGIRHGVSLLLLGVILIPVWMFISPLFPNHDRFVESAPSTTFLEQLFWILMWVSFLAGAARMIYAFAFERRSSLKKQNENSALDSNEKALPSGEDFRPADVGRWRTTDELFEPVAHRRTTDELA